LLLLDAARTGARLMLSTGMGTLGEVEEALGALAFGMMSEGEPAGRQDFAAALLDPAAWRLLQSRVVLMHCTTEYPAAVADSNLRAMDTMRAAFALPVGYSDHTEGNAMSIAAVARGAVVIEKHFTLDRGMEGPDHAASVEPDELAVLVRDIRAVELGLGSGIKQPGAAEMRNRPIARKCVVAARDIPKDHVLSVADLTTKRAGGTISAMALWDLVGRRASKDYGVDQPLGEDGLA
ncbi:MAG: N-acetylneuraminate synthase, partial [Rhodobacterales bacterium 17-64-5]